LSTTAVRCGFIATDTMTRATVCYFGSLATAMALIGSVLMGMAPPDSIVRLLVGTAAAGCAIVAWGAAVMMASMRRTVWPLATLTFLIVASVATFALVSGRG
jgi:hypothetical protein